MPEWVDHGFALFSAAAGLATDNPTGVLVVVLILVCGGFAKLYLAERKRTAAEKERTFEILTAELARARDERGIELSGDATEILDRPKRARRRARA